MLTHGGAVRIAPDVGPPKAVRRMLTHGGSVRQPAQCGLRRTPVTAQSAACSRMAVQYGNGRSADCAGRRSTEGGPPHAHAWRFSTATGAVRIAPDAGPPKAVRRMLTHGGSVRQPAQCGLRRTSIHRRRSAACSRMAVQYGNRRSADCAGRRSTEGGPPHAHAWRFSTATGAVRIAPDVGPPKAVRRMLTHGGSVRQPAQCGLRRTPVTEGSPPHAHAWRFSTATGAVRIAPDMVMEGSPPPPNRDREGAADRAEAPKRRIPAE